MVGGGGTKGRSGGNRHVDTADPSKPDGGVIKPDGISPAVDAIWDEMVSRFQLELRSVDSYQFYNLCLLQSDIELLAKELKANPKNDKLRTQLRQNMMQVSRLSAQFGLSPADRKRMQTSKDVARDDFMEWLET